LSPAALVWLVQYWSSSEAAWRVQRHQRVNVVQSRSRLAEVQQGSVLGIDMAAQTDWPGQAIALGKRLESSRPTLAAEPAVRFPIAAAYRRQGLPREAERFYLNFARSRPHDAWWACADGERWLSAPSAGTPAKPVWPCFNGAKPYLDGQLDDEVWQQARPATLSSPHRDDADWPAVAMLAHDEEFLYVALRCQRAPHAHYQPTEGPRPRDPDLSLRDRVELCIDLDRDYATYYHLTIDHRGWTGEACWGDRTWNPTWFVAAASADDTWTAEAAVPLNEIAAQAAAPGSVWAIGMQRIVPGAGFQSWAHPASPEIQPHGFGYLLFDPGR
jgi:hypothetical protein